MLLAIFEVPEESPCSSALKSVYIKKKKNLHPITVARSLAIFSPKSYHVVFVLDLVCAEEAIIFIKIHGIILGFLKLVDSQ